MTDLPALPAGFQLASEDDVSEIPAGWQVTGQKALPALPPGFELAEDQPAPSRAYHAQLLPGRKDEEGKLHWALPGFVDEMLSAAALPGDVYSGKVDVSSEEARDRAIGLAGMVVGGNIPRAGATLLDGAGRQIPRTVKRAIERDQIPMAEIPARIRDLGAGGVVADLGANLRDTAAAIATTPGAGQQTVTNALRARQLAAPGRVTQQIDEILGIAPVPSYLQREIQGNQRAVGPLYDQALAQADPVDTAHIAQHLDDIIPELRGPAQSALQNVRAMLNATGTDELDPRATTLFQVRRAIDGMTESANDGTVRTALNQVRGRIDHALGRAAPGFDEVDARYRDLARQREAVDRGQTVLGNGRYDPRPAELADEALAGTVPSSPVVGPAGVTHRLRQGARAEIDRIVGTNLNDRAALNSLLKGQSDWNYDRLVTLFGRERTDQLYRVLENERAMAETENRALAGSKTAAVRAAQEEVAPVGGRPGVVRSLMDLKPGTATAELIDAIFGGAMENNTARRNAEIATILMSPGPFQALPRQSYIPVGELMHAIMGGDEPPPARR